MSTEFATETKRTAWDEPAMKEYSLVIDGVIEVAEGADEKSFFDGLLDAIIEYVEKHDALAGLSMVWYCSAETTPTAKML